VGNLRVRKYVDARIEGLYPPKKANKQPQMWEFVTCSDAFPGAFNKDKATNHTFNCIVDQYMSTNLSNQPIEQ